MSRFERYAIRVISALVVVMTLWTAYRLEATVRGHNTATVCACASVPCPMLSTRTTSGIPGISVANNNNVPIPAIPASIIASTLPTTTAVSTTTNAPPSTTAAPTSTPSTAPLTSSQPSAVVGTAVVSPAKDLTTAPTTPDTRTGHDPAFVIRDAMDPEVARNTVRNDVGFSFSDRWRENIWRQQMHDYNVDQQRYSRRRRFARVPTAQPPDPPKDSADQLGGTKVNPYVPPAVPPTPPTPLAGPLCVFVPANAHDAKHEAELLGFVESWADDSTVLFSERKEALEVARVRQRNISLHHADLAAWNSWHEQTVLAEIKLRRRGATADSIRGRGQLSIPLFHWISQLVKRNDPLVQNCKWFMKCDTDTYLRRGLLEREVLNKLDHTKPYHVGVPLKFNTRPYHHTLRTIEFDYNIGGPGYTFSRGLMASVDTAECVRSMTSDPVLLIHDDVATGFCATYYSPNSALVEIRTAISSSAGPPVTRLLTGKNKIVVEPNGYVADVIRNDSCVTRFTAAHPVEGVVMRMLAHHDRELTGVTREPLSGRCDMKIMAGADVKIGGDWTMDRELRNMFDQWRWLWIDRRRHFVSEDERPRVENALDLHKILFEKD